MEIRLTPSFASGKVGKVIFVKAAICRATVANKKLRNILRQESRDSNNSGETNEYSYSNSYSNSSSLYHIPAPMNLQLHGTVTYEKNANGLSLHFNSSKSITTLPRHLFLF